MKPYLQVMVSIVPAINFLCIVIGLAWHMNVKLTALQKYDVTEPCPSGWELIFGNVLRHGAHRRDWKKYL